MKNKLILNWEEACDFINKNIYDVYLFCVENDDYILNRHNIPNWKNHKEGFGPDPFKSNFKVPEKWFMKDNKLNKKLYPNNKILKGYILKEMS